MDGVVEFFSRPDVVNLVLLWTLVGILLACMALGWHFRRRIPASTFLLLGAFLLTLVASAIASTTAFVIPDDEGTRFVVRYIGVGMRTTAIIFLMANIAYGVRSMNREVHR